MKLPFALARRFVAGETFDRAVPAVETLLDDGLFVTLVLLGEDVLDRERANTFTERYRSLLYRIADGRIRLGVEAHTLSISIKLSMLGQVIDEGLCEENLRRLMEAAAETNTFIRLDMEGSDLTQSTLDVFGRVHPDFPGQLGIVLQAYLKRTGEDIEQANKQKARVRLCKGAYKEPAELAYQKMLAIREQFVTHIKSLLQNGTYPAIATHDSRLIEATKTFIQKERLSPDDFEFQMLYGLLPRTQRRIVAEGYRMRVYVPYGTEWFPYFSRRLRERKENVFFVLKNLVRG